MKCLDSCVPKILSVNPFVVKCKYCNSDITMLCYSGSTTKIAQDFQYTLELRLFWHESLSEVEQKWLANRYTRGFKKQIESLDLC